MQADNPLQASRQGSILTFFVVHYDGIVRMLVGGLGVGLRLALRRQLFMYIYIYIYTFCFTYIHMYTCDRSTPRSALVRLVYALHYLCQLYMQQVYASLCGCLAPVLTIAAGLSHKSIDMYIYIYIYICFTYYILHITYIYIQREREIDIDIYSIL